jgi:hypothetical protein
VVLFFFNHFVRATRPPTQDLLWQVYQRGAAFMPELNFPGCDIIVPICLPDAKNPKSRPMMTFIAVQVKNRKGDKLTAGLRNEARFSSDSTAEQWETNDMLNPISSL